MEAFAAALRPIADRTAWWVRHREVRVLSIATSSNLREAAAELVLAQEYHADNVSPFVRLDAPYLRDAAGWDERTAAARSQYEARAAKMAKSGLELPPIGPVPASPEGPLTRFGRQLVQLLDAQRAPLSGLVVVLCPSAVTWGDQLERDLRALVMPPDLKAVRWIVIEPEKRAIGRLVADFGSAGSKLDSLVDDKAVREDFSRKVRASLETDGSAPALAQVGAAWPRGVSPPARRSPGAGAVAMPQKPMTVTPPSPPTIRPPTIEAAALASTGILSEAFRSVRGLTLKAALAMRENDPVSAIRTQRDVVRACRKAGREREAFVMELVLASYVVQAGDRPKAEELYRDVAQRAQDADFADVAVQALLGAAALRLIARDRDTAAALYGQAGALARDRDQDALAIEGFRMAGQLRAEDGDEERASRLFSEALAIGNRMPRAEVPQTSAPLAARQLATLCRKLGLKAQADSLEAQAARLERPIPAAESPS